MIRSILPVLLCTGLAWCAAAQCVVPNKLFLPQADQAKLSLFGTNFAVFDDILVAGAPYNDSLEVDAGVAYVYQLTAADTWEKIATLAPSDPQSSGSFATRVTVDENTVIVSRRYWDVDGDEIVKLYVFEKNPGEVWTSRTEAYQLSDVSALDMFVLHDDELITFHQQSGKAGIRILKRTAGVFAAAQFIELPQGKDGRNVSNVHLAADGNMIVVGASEFINSDDRYGIVFVYEKTGSIYNTALSARLLWDNLPVDGIRFADNLCIHNNTIFVTAASYRPTLSILKQAVYIFEKPATGWTDMKLSPAIIGDFPSLYQGLVAQDNYLLIGTVDNTRRLYPTYAIQGFKKTASWEAGVQSFVIPSPLPGNMFASCLSITRHHLLAGAPIFAYDHENSFDAIADFQLPLGDWENARPTQVMQEYTINASDDFYGISMTANHTYLFVGATSDDASAYQDGAVYIHDRSNEHAAPLKLYSPSLDNITQFGNALAAGDSLLFVGAMTEDSLTADGEEVAMVQMGKVYQYNLTKNGWEYRRQILAPHPEDRRQFGQALAYWKDYLAVSEFQTGDSDNNGKVYLYKKDGTGNFNHLATLRPSETIRGDFFGRSLIMNDSMIVVATGNTEYSTTYQMKVYVFIKKDEWKSATEDAYLLPTTKKWMDFFGYSIATDGDHIVVGAPGYPGRNVLIPPTEFNRGSAYIFKMPNGGWRGIVSEEARLQPSDPSDYGYFGVSVVIDDDNIFVGSPHTLLQYNVVNNNNNNDNRIKPGKIYQYLRPGTGWRTTAQEDAQILSSGPEWLDGFGYLLLNYDKQIYTSALLDDTSMGFGSGSVQTIKGATTIAANDPVCLRGAAVQLYGYPAGGQWSGTAVNATTGMFNPYAAGLGTHQIDYTANGCTVSRNLEVVDFNPTVLDRSAADQFYCTISPTTVSLNTTADAQAYTWLYQAPGAAEFAALDAGKKTISVDKAGLYLVTIDHRYCPLREYFTLAFDTPIVVAVEDAPVVCNDDPLVLTASPAGGVWSGDIAMQQNTIDPHSIPDGDYVVRYTAMSEKNCPYSDTQQVRIEKLREPVLRPETAKICAGGGVLLSLDNVDVATTIQWFNASGDAPLNQTTPSLTVNEPGTYYAKVTKHSCSLESSMATLEMEADSLYVPNIFTPNSDSYNDYFEVTGSGLNDFALQIFNRYGELVHQSADPTSKWTGGDLATGVYYWRVTYRACSASVREAKGWVHLMR